MKHLIVTYGAKQGGKTTSITELYAFIMTQKGLIPSCKIDPNGKLYIVYSDEECVHFDIDDNHPQIMEFKQNEVWPYIKHVNFADALKNAVIELFSIPRELVYGTDVQKNTLTHIRWSDVLHMATDYRHRQLADKLGNFMTVRELLQFFGTDICRSFDKNCHIRSAFTKLMNSDTEIGCIPDGRFENEFEFFDLPETRAALEAKGTKVWRIKLKKNIHPNNPPGEQGLPEISEDRYDLVLHNEEMPVLEKNLHFINFLLSKEVISPIGLARQ